jgi:type VI secretion system protein ImpF
MERGEQLVWRTAGLNPADSLPSRGGATRRAAWAERQKVDRNKTMDKIQPDQPLMPSVLDRLLDDEPGVRRDVAQTHHQVLRELKQSVRRDLEHLLNTRSRCLPWPPELDDLEQSLVNYGVPDIIRTAMATDDDRQRFRDLLEAVIRRWEPRFQSVHVHLLDNAEVLDRTLRFRIDALLYATPAPEPVVFDSDLDPNTGTIEVRGASR